MREIEDMKVKTVETRRQTELGGSEQCNRRTKGVREEGGLEDAMKRRDIDKNGISTTE